MPVLPAFTDGGYLITQAVADFLSTHPTLDIDGIYFPSVQSCQAARDEGGHNAILFHKAARVLNSLPEEKLETRATLEPIIGDDACEGPSITTLSDPKKLRRRTRRWEEDEIAPALELLRDTVVVHLVRGVEVITEAVAVKHVPFRAEDTSPS